MHIIGCCFHARLQQIAMLDTTTGEIIEQRLEHETGEAKAFYGTLSSPALVGIEATGHAQWFERRQAELGHELWVGNPALIRAAVVTKQKTDSRDASHILPLLIEERFPRIWIPSPAEQDVRQLLWHRHKLVCFRTSVKNQLHALAVGQGVCRRTRLWTRTGRQELERLALSLWASRRRGGLLELLDRLNPPIEELDHAVVKEAESCAEVVLLMSQRGVGPVTALAFVLTLGPVSRFHNSKQVVSYLGLNPREDNSGGPERLGSISRVENPCTHPGLRGSEVAGWTR